MSLKRNISVLLTLLVLLVALPPKADAVSRVMLSVGEAAAAGVDDNTEKEQPHFEFSTTPLLSTTPVTSSSQNVTPIVRTLPRAIRSVERGFQYTKAVSAIDSSTAAQRYGLYNHRVLFVSLARDYYLARTEVLRI